VAKLHRHDLDPDPILELKKWINLAASKKIRDYNAMVLSTVDQKGNPNARVVLLKEIDEMGLIFFTNHNSTKALEIEFNPNVAVTFYWPELEKQIRIRALVSRLEDEKNDFYFNQRDRKSKAASISSMQSVEIRSRKDLIKNFHEVLEKNNLTRPHYWGGYRVIPYEYEFWQGREYRLNDRFVYRKENDQWKISRLSP